MNDYISRDYLLAEYDRQHQGPPGGARKIIAEAPAADVVEVRHGQWYLDNGCAYCSECKNSFAPGIRSQALFCPRCGAKMDGGKDE